MSNGMTTASGPIRQPRDAPLIAGAAIAVIAAATIAGAWFFELVLDIRPCPLCLQQRYAYYLAIPLASLVAIGAAQGISRRWLVAGLIVIGLALLANAGLGVYHAGVEWKFWQGPTDCSGPFIDLSTTGNLLDGLNKVKVIRCDEVQWRFLGLSLAGYNALISLALAVLAAWGVAKAREPANGDRAADAAVRRASQ